MDKDIHLAENNEYKNGDNVPIKAIDNNDGTYSLAFDSVNSLKTQSFDFAKRSSFNTVFGESVVASRQNNINIPFIRSNGNIGLESNLKSTDYFQSGTATQSNTNQTAYMESGSGVGLSEIKSKNTNRYITGHISDCFFTTVYNDIDVGVDSGVGYGSIRGGDFIGFGYKGLDYGIWLKLRGVETFIKQVDWNTRTLLDGDFILNTTKENIMSISFGYAVADILFSIKSNSGWTLVHRHRTANKVKQFSKITN